MMELGENEESESDWQCMNVQACAYLIMCLALDLYLCNQPNYDGMDGCMIPGSFFLLI